MRIRPLSKWLGLALVALITTWALWFFLRGGDPMHRERATLKGGPEAFSNVAFSPDGKLLAAGQQGGTVTIWEAETGKAFLTVPGRPAEEGYVSALAFSPDGRILAWGGGGKRVTLLDLA